MTPLTISIKLAQKLIESSKIRDFEITYKTDKGETVKVSKFQFKREGILLRPYLKSVQAKTCSLSLTSREKSMVYNLLLERKIKALEI
jgi:hypothetical protein